MKWKFVWLITTVLLTLVLVWLAVGIWRMHGNRTLNLSNQFAQPLIMGFTSAADLTTDATQHCVTLPKAMTLASLPSAKELTDTHLHGSDEWAALAKRMKPGDLIYAYGHLSQPAPGMSLPDAFAGRSGGYLVMRQKCLVGMYGE